MANNKLFQSPGDTPIQATARELAQTWTSMEATEEMIREHVRPRQQKIKALKVRIKELKEEIRKLKEEDQE